MSDPQTLEPSIIVIFGITGDLSQRYLLPALYHLIQDNLLHEQSRIIGVSRSPLAVDELFGKVELCVNEIDNVCDPLAIQKMRDHTEMFQMNLSEEADYHRLHDRLDAIEETTGVCMNRLYYLSIPPQVYGPIITLMGKSGLNMSCQHGTANSRLLVEKPFGYDLESAVRLIASTADVWGEHQVYRIDHYLAKETVQNILTFRFENPIFESQWNAEHIEQIEISASEQIGIEGRAQFYEPVGALRDFIQSHLIQILAIATMDQPTVLDSDHIHDSKQSLLAQVLPVAADKLAEQAVRGQYQGYTEEVNNQDSITETFAAVRLQIDSQRWRGVPIIIWTGKALAEKKTEISVTFKGSGLTSNTLRFRIQPNEGIELDVIAKKPGFDAALQTTTMDFSYQQNFGGNGHPNAYERVLVDAVKGDHTLFATSEEVLAAWRILQPVVGEWSKDGHSLEQYPKGSSGQSLLEPLR